MSACFQRVTIPTYMAHSEPSQGLELVCEHCRHESKAERPETKAGVSNQAVKPQRDVEGVAVHVAV